MSENVNFYCFVTVAVKKADVLSCLIWKMQNNRH